MAQGQHWSLDKRVPLAVILTMIGQVVALVYWLSGIDNRLSVLESGRYEDRIQSMEREIPVIHEKIDNIDKATDRIEKKIDKLSSIWPQRHSREWQQQEIILAEMKALGEIEVIV